MTLTAALRIAQSSLFNVSQQTVLSSRNISEVGNENFVRREARIASTEYGARIYSIGRGDAPALYRSSIAALSDSSAQNVIAGGASRLNTIVNGVDNLSAPTTHIDRLREALQTYATDASNPVLAGAAVDAAGELAASINAAAQGIQDYRAEIDRQISADVGRMGDLLAQFEEANNAVIDATRTGTDPNDALDRRDKLVKDLSQYVSITTMTRDGNDMVLLAGQGITLFETVPRAVSFEPTTAYAPGVSGNTLRIDGVPLIVGQGANTSASGSLSALVQARDVVASQSQAQLDEIARGLVTAFAETDRSGGGGAPLAGLFSHAGGPAIPAAGTVAPGLSLSLTVNAAYDPAQGGNASLLRDGGANGAAYNANPSGFEAFADELLAHIGRLDAPMAFDASTGIAGDKSLAGFASASVGWIDAQRETATRASEAKTALYQKLSGDYLAQTGVSIDDEMAKLIALEQSYDASARIMSVVDEMMRTLLAAVR